MLSNLCVGSIRTSVACGIAYAGRHFKLLGVVLDRPFSMLLTNDLVHEPSKLSVPVLMDRTGNF